MWVRNRYCTECGHRFWGYAKRFSASDLVQLEYPCENCGCHTAWRDYTEKWHSESVWWRPLTWGKGKWVRRI